MKIKRIFLASLSSVVSLTTMISSSCQNDPQKKPEEKLPEYKYDETDLEVNLKNGINKAETFAKDIKESDLEVNSKSSNYTYKLAKMENASGVLTITYEQFGKNNPNTGLGQITRKIEGFKEDNAPREIQLGSIKLVDNADKEKIIERAKKNRLSYWGKTKKINYKDKDTNKYVDAFDVDGDLKAKIDQGYSMTSIENQIYGKGLSGFISSSYDETTKTITIRYKLAKYSKDGNHDLSDQNIYWLTFKME